MKGLITLSILVMSTVTLAHDPIPHMDLEMEGREYQQLKSARDTNAGELTVVEAFGIRNLEWIDHINKSKSPENKLSFSVKFIKTGIPITEPKKYNPTIILKDYNELLTKLPPEMKSVLVDKAPFTDDVPMDQEVYLEWGRQVDKIYGTAIRWKTMQPYLTFLEARRSTDLRGYYNINQTPEFENEIANFKSLPIEKQTTHKKWLINICANKTTSFTECTTEFDAELASGNLRGMYSKYFANSKALWNSYFNLTVKRADVFWSNNTQELLTIPFLDNLSPDVLSFVKDNVEEEWQLPNWKLKFDLKSSGDIPRIVFKPGVTANVNALGGNIITMDSNTPLTELTLHWVIRHEFGHVLGFKDCYLEFYDPEEKLIMNYQLDTTDLMCSRAGRLKEAHFQELKDIYTLQ